MHLNRRLASVVGAVGLALAGAVVVYAAWSGTGSGNGSAGSAQIANIKLSVPTAGPADDIYPGNANAAGCTDTPTVTCTAGSVSTVVSNPNAFAVYVGGSTGSNPYGGLGSSSATITVCSSGAGATAPGMGVCPGASSPPYPVTPATACPATTSTNAPTVGIDKNAPQYFSEQSVPANGTTTITVRGIVDMDPSAPNSCQQTLFIVQGLTLGFSTSL